MHYAAEESGLKEEVLWEEYLRLADQYTAIKIKNKIFQQPLAKGYLSTVKERF